MPSGTFRRFRALNGRRAEKAAGIFSGVSDTILWIDGTTTATNCVLYLERAGFTVECVAGNAALSALARAAPILVILDIAPNGLSGVESCRVMRARSDVPILVLTAENTEGHILRDLENEADDYLVQPFSPREVVARVATILRRALPASRFVLGPLELDLEHHEARLDGAGLPLTPGELRILATLMSRPGEVFRREELLAAFPEGERSARTIDAHISNLRKKFARSRPAAAGTPRLETIHGFGYRLAAANPQVG